MNDEPKQKRAVVRRKRVKPTERAEPKEVRSLIKLPHLFLRR